MNAEKTKAVTDETAPENLYSPASGTEIEAALSRCADAVSLIPYMEVEETTIQESAREMLLIRCRTRTDSFSLDMVEIDVSTVWRATVARENDSMQTIQEVRNGFDFRFAILNPDHTYLTGLIEVRRPDHERLRIRRLSRISPK